MGVNGLNDEDWKLYEDVLIKANSLQLVKIKILLEEEVDKRRRIRDNNGLKVIRGGKDE